MIGNAILLWDTYTGAPAHHVYRSLEPSVNMNWYFWSVYRIVLDLSYFLLYSEIHMWGKEWGWMGEVATVGLHCNWLTSLIRDRSQIFIKPLPKKPNCFNLLKSLGAILRRPEKPITCVLTNQPNDQPTQSLKRLTNRCNRYCRLTCDAKSRPSNRKEASSRTFGPTTNFTKLIGCLNPEGVVLAVTSRNDLITNLEGPLVTNCDG